MTSKGKLSNGFVSILRFDYLERFGQLPMLYLSYNTIQIALNDIFLRLQRIPMLLRVIIVQL